MVVKEGELIVHGLCFQKEWWQGLKILQIEPCYHGHTWCCRLIHVGLSRWVLDDASSWQLKFWLCLPLSRSTDQSTFETIWRCRRYQKWHDKLSHSRLSVQFFHVALQCSQVVRGAIPLQRWVIIIQTAQTTHHLDYHTVAILSWFALVIVTWLGIPWSPNFFVWLVDPIEAV